MPGFPGQLPIHTFVGSWKPHNKSRKNTLRVTSVDRVYVEAPRAVAHRSRGWKGLLLVVKLPLLFTLLALVYVIPG